MIFAQMMPGMEWIPLILLTMAVNGLCGLVSLYGSLFFPQSKCGFRAGWASVIIGAVSFLFFLLVIGGNLTPVGYSLISAPSTAGVLGLLVYGARRSRAFPWLRIGISAVTILIAGLLLRWWRIDRIADEEMVAIVSGSERVAIVGFRVEGQQRLVDCTDGAICDYLTEALRKAQRGELLDVGKGLDFGGAGVHTFTFRFASGHMRNVRTDPYKNGLVLSVDPWEPGWPTHEVAFSEPIPDGLRQILAFLGRKCEDAAGEVLIVEEARPPATYYDQRLNLCGRFPPNIPPIESRY